MWGLLFILVLGDTAAEIKPVASDAKLPDCTSDVHYDEFGHANLNEVYSAVLALKDSAGNILVKEIPQEWKQKLAHYFDADFKTTSRLEQFYALLHLLSELLSPVETLDMDVSLVQKLIHNAKVFQKPDLVDAMTKVEIKWNKRRQEGRYKVLFNAPELAFDLNRGKGFKAFQHGYCQHVKKLILYGELNVTTELLKNGNLYVSYNEPVDLYGDIGSRGLVKVNISYVTLKTLEFLHGSRLGTTKAKISRREFETTDHSWFLRWVSRLVSETSTQQIDW